MGSRLLRPDQLPSKLIYTISGTVRILGISPSDQGQITLAKEKQPGLYGWLSLLRAQPSEFIQCSTNIQALALNPSDFIRFYQDNDSFADFFNTYSPVCEQFGVSLAAIDLAHRLPSGWKKQLNENLTSSQCFLYKTGDSLPPIDKDKEYSWHLSTPGVPGYEVGAIITDDCLPLPSIKNFNLGIRLILLPKSSEQDTLSSPSDKGNTIDTPFFYNSDIESAVNLESLGIFRPDINKISHFPSRRNATTQQKYVYSIFLLLCD